MLGKRVFYIRPTGWTGIIALSVFFLLFMALIMHTILVRVQQVKQIIALCDKLLTAYRWDHEWKRLVDLAIATLFASLLCNHAFSFTIPFCFFKRVFFSGLFRSLYYRPWIPSLLQYRGKIQTNNLKGSKLSLIEKYRLNYVKKKLNYGFIDFFTLLIIRHVEGFHRYRKFGIYRHACNCR